MRKVLSLALAFMLVVAAAPAAFAANTTTLTTTVPPATYTLNIPADQAIAFGNYSTEIGNVTVTESSGFASGKNLAVTVTYDAFKSDAVSTTIPFKLSYKGTDNGSTKVTDLPSGDQLLFRHNSGGAVYEKASVLVSGASSYLYFIDSISLVVNSSAWGKALAGEYTGTITFTAEVLVEP